MLPDMSKMPVPRPDSRASIVTSEAPSARSACSLSTISAELSCRAGSFLPTSVTTTRPRSRPRSIASRRAVSGSSTVPSLTSSPLKPRAWARSDEGGHAAADPGRLEHRPARVYDDAGLDQSGHLAAAGSRRPPPRSCRTELDLVDHRPGRLDEVIRRVEAEPLVDDGGDPRPPGLLRPRLAEGAIVPAQASSCPLMPAPPARGARPRPRRARRPRGRRRPGRRARCHARAGSTSPASGSPRAPARTRGQISTVGGLSP